MSAPMAPLLPAPARKRRRPSLTPMIDVVFLLLVFFMLASRFGAEQALTLPLAQAGAPAQADAPRLVDVTPAGLRLNGVALPAAQLTALLAEGGAAAVVVLRPREAATLQHLVDAAETLRAAGFANLAVVE